MTDSLLSFGHFQLREDLRQVLVDDKPVKLGARAFDVLLALTERRDRVVSKNELLDIVWPKTVVEEGNLLVHIWALRKLLGHQAITTIPGRGYRFTAALAGDRPQGMGGPEHGVNVAVVAPTLPLLKTNLPEALQPLIGRDDDTAALTTLVAQHRLVTITGAGGMGKTRLAQHLLHRQRDAYEHGVCWVELAGISDPQLVASTIASALGIQIGTSDALTGLAAAIKGMTLLMALDNAEHLVEEVSRVAQTLVGAAPGLSLLVTSQAPLKCSSERVYRIGPLAVPEEVIRENEALAYGAVALFVERAQAADRRFELSAENFATVIDVCRKLDGMALAIELAAARLPMLGVARLAATLNERLRVLIGGRRDSPKRQQTLRAALEWSHGLLNAEEAAVFRRLGVFVGGFGLEMAQKVVTDPEAEPPMDEWLVLDVLSALVDRSLVAVDAGEAPRYRLLESARAFALERLIEAGEHDSCRRRHARAVFAHFEAIDAESWAGRTGIDASLAMLAPDLDNGREAMAWAMRHDVLRSLAFTPVMSRSLPPDEYCERRQLWERTAPQMTDDVPDEIRGPWALGFSTFFPPIINAPLSLGHAHLARNLFRRLGNVLGVYRSLAAISHAIDLRDPDGRRAALVALDEMRSIESSEWSATVKIIRAQADWGYAAQLGDHEAARAANQRVLLLAEMAGNQSRMAAFESRQIEYLLATQNEVAAVAVGAKLEKRLRESRNQFDLGWVRVQLMTALLAQGAIQPARDLAMLAWPQVEQFDEQSFCADRLAWLAVLERRARTSARLLGYADSALFRSGCFRGAFDSKVAERVERLLRAQMGDAELERLKAEGAALDGSSLAALAFGTEDVQ